MKGAEPFGMTAEGRNVERVRIAAGRLSARIITWGAVLQDLRFEGHDPPLVLGFPRFENYPRRSPYFGAIVGRYANRIRDGRFVIDGETHRADRNHLGAHLLHGGRNGIDRKLWEIGAQGKTFVTLRLLDRDGEMGFPGNLDISCTYRIVDGQALAIDLSATTDKPTLCNLAHHSYFNLDDGGAGTIGAHSLTIDADAYLPVDDQLIPTGEIASVVGTQFDFRSGRSITADSVLPAYDHNYCLANERRSPTEVARLQAARSRLEMRVETTEPGLQFYAGATMPEGLHGLDGIIYGPASGLCLEPQTWPDSPNHPHFPTAVLRPGETYRQRSIYRFSLSAG